MRLFVLVGSGVLLLVAAGYFAVGSLTPRPSPPAAAVYEPPVPRRAGVPEWEWRNPVPPFEPDPNSPYTPLEQIIRRHMREAHPDSGSRDELARYKKRGQQFRDAGGLSPDALPVYLRMLTPDSGMDWRDEGKILQLVSWIDDGDRSAFRRPAAERLKHRDGFAVREAVRLLKEIGTPAEAAEVVRLIETFEFDHPNDHSYGGVAYAVLDTLTAIGTEAEIQALDQAKARNFLWGNDKFWANAEECKKAIRERLAKEKQQANKK